MKRIRIQPNDALALVAVATLALGVALVHGIGWALIVVSALVLLYLVLPDQRGAP